MQRYNLFFPVHKGLRALLFETARELQQTNFSDAAEARAALQQVKTVVTLFESHARKEDDYVLAALAAYEPSVVDAFEQEHAENHALGQNLQQWQTAYRYAVAPSAKKTVGEELARAFVQFTTFNLRHMAKEEQVINPLLWRYYTDGELQAITERILKSTPPQQLAFFSRWMVRGLNNAEILDWLNGVKKSASLSLYHGLLSVAQAELHPHRWHFLQNALQEDLMVA